MIQDHDPAPLAAGDLVDVVGFPEIAGFGPALRGAQVKAIAIRRAARARAGHRQEAMKRRFRRSIVQIEGTLIDQLQLPARAGSGGRVR
jgi:hypothetical protein